MRPGIVVQMRVNPNTAQSVIDILETAGMETKDKSFAVCVSAALNILVDTAKTSGIIPEPDPFNYVNKLRYHVGEEAPDRRKFSKKNVGFVNPAVFPTGSQALKIAGTTGDIAQKVRETVQKRESTPAEEAAPIDTDDALLNAEVRAAQLRVTDALIKMDKVMEGVVGVSWTPKDQEDYDRDCAFVNANR